MKILKARLQEEALKNSIKWEVIEQDYVLSWVLEGIASIPELKKHLIFKGGTALKKIYFGNYRFSQDLDFSINNTELFKYDLESLIKEVCERATEKAQDYGENIEFKSEPYTEKQPHPEGQKAFTIQARLPWHRDFYTTVYAEISFQELILLPPIDMPIIHPYGENLDGKLLVYPLEEIIAEKVRALLQFARKLHERGWGRSRVRDYYDLWRILKDFRVNLNCEQISDLIAKKCLHKGISFTGIEAIFQPKLMENIDKDWSIWLSDMVPNLPDKALVIKDLKILFQELRF